MYGASGSNELVRELEKAQARLDGNEPGIDFAPLMAQVTRFQAYVAPAVRAHVESAREQAKSDPRGAAQKLRLAREQVFADFAMVPVEDAFARVVAAQKLVEEGKPERAERLLGGIPVLVSEIKVSQPLVPIRFNLRAAAVAAEQSNWRRASALMESAADRLEALSRAVDPAACRELRTIEQQARSLERKLGSDDKPAPERIRQLARMTSEVGAG
jgi:hypothetical protein